MGVENNDLISQINQNEKKDITPFQPIDMSKIYAMEAADTENLENFDFDNMILLASLDTTYVSKEKKSTTGQEKKEQNNNTLENEKEYISFEEIKKQYGSMSEKEIVDYGIELTANKNGLLDYPSKEKADRFFNAVETYITRKKVSVKQGYLLLIYKAKNLIEQSKIDTQKRISESLCDALKSESLNTSFVDFTRGIKLKVEGCKNGEVVAQTSDGRFYVKAKILSGTNNPENGKFTLEINGEKENTVYEGHIGEIIAKKMLSEYGVR